MSAILKNNRHNGCDLYVKCDVCGYEALVYQDQTDRCLIHDYVHENGWKTRKVGKKWIQLCPDCLAEERRKKREEYFHAAD